jgi:hypothetical protein
MKPNYPSVAKACTSGPDPGLSSQPFVANKRRTKLLKFTGVLPVLPGIDLPAGWLGMNSAIFLATYVLPYGCNILQRGGMSGERQELERRKWGRLPLAIPVFVRSRDAKGREFLEFATALNVSAGGMLVAIRRILPSVAQLRLEIPSAPVGTQASLPKAARSLRAKTLRTTPADGYYLLGMKFSRPLALAGRPVGPRRKVVSAL